MSDKQSDAGDAASTVISASCVGGMARQFRVQVASEETLSRWRLEASFGDAAAAHRLAGALRQMGQRARVIECRGLPTAA